MTKNRGLLTAITNLAHDTPATVSRIKWLLCEVTVLYLVSSLLGYALIYLHNPFAVAYYQQSRQTLLTDPVTLPVVNLLLAGNLPFAVAYTFTWNLSIGAFTTTTLPGIIPLVGAFVPLGVSAFHGFESGMILYHASGVSAAYFSVAATTAVLESGAYAFSSAAGVNISLSVAFPRRQRTKSRLIAFKKAWVEAARVYLIVISLLALAAVIEIVGIYFTVVIT